jgi:Mg2+ and Co2+ transporter CorA
MINPTASMRVNTSFNRVVTYYSNTKDKPSNGYIQFDSVDDLCNKKGKDWLVERISTPDTFWLDFSNPTEKQLDSIGLIYQLHPLTIEDLKEASGQGSHYTLIYRSRVVY